MFRNKTIYWLLLLFAILQINFSALAQSPSLPIHQWVHCLSVKEDYRNANYSKVYYSIINMPWPVINSTIDKIKADGDTDNKRFDIRIHFLRAHMYDSS